MDRYITTLLLFKELTEFLLPGNSKEAATLANPEEESDEAKESEADPVEVISSCKHTPPCCYILPPRLEAWQSPPKRSR